MENFLWVTIGDQQFRTAQTKHIPKAFSIILKDFEQIIEIGTFTGAFQVTSLEYAGEFNGEVTYSMSFESAGAITFATV